MPLIQNRTAIHSAVMRHRLSSQIAVQSAIRQNQRVAAIASLALADRLIAVLTDGLVERMGLITNARNVMLAAIVHRHILERRLLVSQIDADVAANKLQEVFGNLRYMLLPQKSPNKVSVVGQVPESDQYVQVVLKLVPATAARAQKDEWWVQTAFPLGKRTRKRLRAQGKLQDLQASA